MSLDNGEHVETVALMTLNDRHFRALSIMGLKGAERIVILCQYLVQIRMRKRLK